jgi:hypothetical protein
MLLAKIEPWETKMNNVWLTLRGVPSPVLYRNPDAEVPARFIMSIGEALPAVSASAVSPARTVTITKTKPNHVLNCQLHLAPSAAADYGNPASPYREIALSRRVPQPPTQEELAYFCFELYWDVLAPFSDVIVIFVPGVGPSRTADILQRWRSSPVTVSRFSPHILIVTEENKDPYLEKVLRIFIGDPQSKLKVSKLTRKSELLSAISSLAEQSNGSRKRLGLNFAQQHRSFLVQTSLEHFCDNLLLPDFVTASRFTNPVPRSTELHLQRLVKPFDSRISELTRLVASALVLDAFPPGMHRKSGPIRCVSPPLTSSADFRPKDMFRAVYKHIIGQLRPAVAAQAFLSQIERPLPLLSSRIEKIS